MGVKLEIFDQPGFPLNSQGFPILGILLRVAMRSRPNLGRPYHVFAIEKLSNVMLFSFTKGAKMKKTHEISVAS